MQCFPKLDIAVEHGLDRLVFHVRLQPIDIEANDAGYFEHLGLADRAVNLIKRNMEGLVLVSWSRKIGQVLRCIPRIIGGCEMTTRRRFTADFKARVALEALRDKTAQEIAARHQVHPNQGSTWKRQALEGLSAVFSNGADHERQDRETEIRDLHAKIGQLTVERDFLSKGLKR